MRNIRKIYINLIQLGRKEIGNTTINNVKKE